MLGEAKRLRERVRVLEELLTETHTALAPLAETVESPRPPKWREDLDAWRRAVVDHIATGLAHPVEAVRTQARALQTELDCAGLNVDADVKSLLASSP